MLADLFDWWEMNRCSVNACPLGCRIAEPRERPDYYSQKRALVPLKAERPWYKGIHSQVLQDLVKRVGKAFDRFMKGTSQHCAICLNRVPKELSVTIAIGAGLSL